jgi:peptide/nickel transport system permease protein
MTEQTFPASQPVIPLQWPRELRWLQQLVHNPAGAAGLILIGLLILTALLASRIAPNDPYDMFTADRMEAPSSHFVLGTDELGRDVFSRVIYGSRISLMVGVVSVLIASLIGGPLGLLAGYIGGWFDEIVMRAMDVIFAFPAIVLAMMVTAFLGPSLRNTMIAIGIVYAPGFSRIVRGSVLAVTQEQYIEAARVVGCRSKRILLTHVLPNVVAPFIVASTVTFSFALLAEAALSFLGLGAQPPEPSWGTMLLTGKRFMEIAPWMAIFPGLAISIAVLGTNLLGDALRDVLDPRLRM